MPDNPFTQFSTDQRAALRQGLNGVLQKGGLTGDKIGRISRALQLLAEVDQPAAEAAPAGPGAAMRFAQGVGSALYSTVAAPFQLAAPPSTPTEVGMNLALGPIGTITTRLAAPQVEQLQQAAPTVEGVGHLAAGLLPGLGPMAADIGEQAGQGDIAGAAGKALTFAALPKIAEKGLGAIKAAAPGVMQEVLNQGEAHANFVRYMHDRALATQSHIAQAANKYREQASSGMARVSKQVDAVNEGGAIPSAPLAESAQRHLGELVKTPENIPSVAQKILNPNPKAVDLEAGLQGINPNALPDDVKAELEAAKSGHKFSFEELKQIRTDLGQEIWGRRERPPKTVRAALIGIYKDASNALADAAEQAGVGPQWLQHNAQFETYQRDFVKSPLRKVIEGNNAKDILGTLTGNDAQRLLDTLVSYKSFGLDPKTVIQATKEFKTGRMAQSFATPSRWEMRFAPMTGGASLLPVLPGRALQNPRLLRSISSPSIAEVAAAEGRAVNPPEYAAIRKMLARRARNQP